MKNRELLQMLLAAGIRHGLTILSAYLVAKHVQLPDDFVGNATNYLVDALPGVIAIVWSMIQKSDTHDAIKQGAADTAAALALPVATPAPSVVVVETPAK